MPEAVNCCVLPEAIWAVAGETEIDTSVGVLTVPEVLAVTLPLVTVTVKLPGAKACSRPVALILATVAGVTVQVAVLEIFWLVPLVKVAVAVNCC